MTYDHLLVDLDRIVSLTEREQMKDVAEKHNALVRATGTLHRELDSVTGSTQEEKAEMTGFFGKFRVLLHWLHSKKVGTLWASLQLLLLLEVARRMGMEPKQVLELLAQLSTLMIGG